jgi:hypothetical protein
MIDILIAIILGTGIGVICGTSVGLLYALYEWSIE